MDFKGGWVYFNNDFIPDQQLKVREVEFSNSIYEVVRIIERIPLFLEEHLIRLSDSMKILGLAPSFTSKDIRNIMLKLSELCEISNGNIKIELMLLDSHKYLACIYFIPHLYPSDNSYKIGIKTITHRIVRPNPHIKQSIVNDRIRNEIKHIQTISNSSEVILLNKKNEITEGSKSNVFFIGQNTIYSPLSKQILKGITREKIIEIAKVSGFRFSQCIIPYSSLYRFEAGFLTSTSFKVLPINQIDKHELDPKHKTIITIQNLYNQLIENYCLKNQKV